MEARSCTLVLRAALLISLTLLTGCASEVVVHRLEDPAPEQAGQAGHVFVPPQAVYTPDPDSGWFRGRLGHRERAQVRFCITRAGKTEEIEVESGSRAMRDALTVSLTKWRYKPALIDGERVESCRTMVFEVEKARVSSAHD